MVKDSIRAALTTESLTIDSIRSAHFACNHPDCMTWRKAHPMKRKWIVCPVCDGEGKTVNPNIDCHGLTSQDFAEDPDFAEDYMNGHYDIRCNGCGGDRVVTRERIKQLEQNARDRRYAAQEAGDWESFSGAGDWRFG